MKILTDSLQLADTKGLANQQIHPVHELTQLDQPRRLDKNNITPES